jgi:hypothetical protein
MISFVTCVKLMGGYETYAERLKDYIESIYTQCTIPYEIIVVEDINTKNTKLIRDCFSNNYFKDRNVIHIEYIASYPNPHQYNMIEAFTKNVGIYDAKYNFICVTNCDITFDSTFFTFLPTIQPNIFYRFIQYEKDETGKETCINPALKDKTQWTLYHIARKSGDIMLMDKQNWHKIKGYPENTVWVHSDLIVCKVVNNNKIPIEIPPNVKIYTLPQERNYTEQPYELQKTLEYFNVCN